MKTGWRNWLDWGVALAFIGGIILSKLGIIDPEEGHLFTHREVQARCVASGHCWWRQ